MGIGETTNPTNGEVEYCMYIGKAIPKCYVLITVAGEDVELRLGEGVRELTRIYDFQQQEV